jgi:hypothetical protein
MGSKVKIRFRFFYSLLKYIFESVEDNCQIIYGNEIGKKTGNPLKGLPAHNIVVLLYITQYFQHTLRCLLFGIQPVFQYPIFVVFHYNMFG